MNFREATDSLCQRIDHEDVANALGVSVQAIRQARMNPEAKAYREPPKEWQYAVIRLAERRIMRDRQLIEEIRKEV